MYGLYSRAASNQARLMMARVQYIKQHLFLHEKIGFSSNFSNKRLFDFWKHELLKFRFSEKAPKIRKLQTFFDAIKKIRKLR